MRIIENKIHFIWVGDVIRAEYAAEILRCLDMNYSNYSLHVWTDRPQENGMQMREVASDHYSGKRKLFTSLADVGDAGDASKLEITYVASRLKILRNNKVKIIEFVSIARLAQGLRNLMRIYDDAMAPQIHNYGRASDILRLGVLKEQGGIYMDIDVECLKPLPKNIKASDDFLMGYGQAGKQAFTNAVMAAPAGSNFIQELMASIDTMYTFWETRNWWTINNRDVIEKRAALAASEERHRKSPGGESRTALGNSRQQYQQAMEAGTLPITGPTRVELFLYKRLLRDKAEDPLEFFAEYIDPERRTPLTFNEAMNSLKLKVKQEMLAHGVKESYSFPMEHLKIRSDASWL